MIASTIRRLAMQLRCYQCGKPYPISREEVAAALETMAAEHQTHYHAVCPHCRRVNKVSRAELERIAPGAGRKPEEAKTGEGKPDVTHA
jgi:phage FluMu protein Com